MKKTIFIFFLQLLLSCSFYSQKTKADSLKILLKSANHDTARCNILNLLIEDEADPSVWQKYNEDLHKISEQNLRSLSEKDPAHKIFSGFLAVSINNAAFLQQARGEFEKSMELFKRALFISTKIGDKTNIAVTLTNIGSMHSYLGNIEQAIEHFLKALKLQEETNNKPGIAGNLNNIGSIYHQQGNIPKALEYYGRSLKRFEELNNKTEMASLLANLGNIYSTQGEMQKAHEFLKKCLKLQQEIGDKSGIAKTYNNFGLLFKMKEQTDSALFYYERALKLHEELGNNYDMAISLTNVGRAYYDMGNFDLAVKYIDKSAKIQEVIGDKEGLAYNSNLLSSFFLMNKKYAKALEYGNKAFRLATELGFPEKIMNTSFQLSKVYQQTGDFNKAFESYKTYISMRDSLINQENRKASFKSHIQYEFDKKEVEIKATAKAEKEKIIIKAEEDKKRQHIIIYSVLTGLILVIVFAVFMVNRFRVTNRQKKIIELKEQEAQKQNVIIAHQKHIVEEHQKEIIDSINYAQRIQKAMLASATLLNANLKDYFIYFNPKDIVSGDFYWATKTHDRFYFIAADSTGHGVPGAFMSLLNISFLNEAINEKNYSQTNHILDHVRQKLIINLSEDGSEGGGKDGMDCSLLCFDFKKNILDFTCANNPIIVIRNGEIIEPDADKMAVGRSPREDQPFSSQRIELQKNDIVYSFTDGYPDQFGGPKGKKFMYKRLKELLVSIAHFPLAEQKEKLSQTINDWKGSSEQVDDILIAGIRISD